jgi:hypothetical protein
MRRRVRVRRKLSTARGGAHVVAPPIAPAREEDRILIRPLGDR